MSESNNSTTTGREPSTNKKAGTTTDEKHEALNNSSRKTINRRSAKSVPKDGNQKSQGKPTKGDQNRNKNRNRNTNRIRNKSKTPVEQNEKSETKSTNLQQRKNGKNLGSIENKTNYKRSNVSRSKPSKPITKKTDPEIEVLKEKQTEELRIVKARLGPKNFQTYKSTPDFTVFAVSCMIDLKALDAADLSKPRQKRKVKFTITVPKFYPRNPITLGDILTPALGSEDSPLQNTHEWNKIVTNFNIECSKLLHEQHQPLLQQLNNFAINFPAMCVPKKRYSEHTDLKRQLVGELSV